MRNSFLFICAMAALAAAAATPFWEDPPTNRPPAAVVQAVQTGEFESRVNVVARQDGCNLNSTPFRGCLIVFQ